MLDDQKFLADLQDSNADVRFAAWRQAGQASPAVIPQLGKLAASSQPGSAKAAREALATMTHAVGKDPSAPIRAAVVKGLLDLSGDGYALPVRVHALRLLSGIAGPDAVPALVKWIQQPDLREEVVFCLERIPGPAAAKALLAAYRDAPDIFKPRLLAALGHLRVAEAVGLCTEAMRSANAEIAVAAVKAFGRIGAKPATPPALPDPKTLSAWQQIERLDGILRYAEARAKEGDAAEALRVYRQALERPEEHWQCAAVIGLARLGSAEAAAVLLTRLNSPNSTVRITARNAWKSMAASKA
ncbi:MAG: hypothetical protein FJW34_15745 [Acidobacteria bacterium]|nr:hypothetical protein [Acidobacteriota bacterium]